MWNKLENFVTDLKSLGWLKASLKCVVWVGSHYTILNSIKAFMFMDSDYKVEPKEVIGLLINLSIFAYITLQEAEKHSAKNVKTLDQLRPDLQHLQEVLLAKLDDAVKGDNTELSFLESEAESDEKIKAMLDSYQTLSEKDKLKLIQAAYVTRERDYWGPGFQELESLRKEKKDLTGYIKSLEVSTLKLNQVNTWLATERLFRFTYWFGKLNGLDIYRPEYVQEVNKLKTDLIRNQKNLEESIIWGLDPKTLNDNIQTIANLAGLSLMFIFYFNLNNALLDNLDIIDQHADKSKSEVEVDPRALKIAHQNNTIISTFVAKQSISIADKVDNELSAILAKDDELSLNLNNYINSENLDKKGDLIWKYMSTPVERETHYNRFLDGLDRQAREGLLKEEEKNEMILSYKNLGDSLISESQLDQLKSSEDQLKVIKIYQYSTYEFFEQQKELGTSFDTDDLTFYNFLKMTL